MLHSALENIRSQNAKISAQNLEIQMQNTDIRGSIQFLSDKFDVAIFELNYLKSDYKSQKIIKSLEHKVRPGKEFEISVD